MGKWWASSGVHWRPVGLVGDGSERLVHASLSAPVLSRPVLANTPHTGHDRTRRDWADFHKLAIAARVA